MKKKMVSILLAALLAVATFAGCGGNDKAQETSGSAGQKEGEKTFVLPINTNAVASITPYNVYGSDDLLIASSPCFDPLFIINKDETRWYLAESLEPTSEDGCHYQLKLKEGLKWHDGEAITADDVVFTVNALLEPTNGTDPSSVCYNGKAITVTKVDDLTADITLQEPFSAFETEFGRIQLFPEHVFDGNVKVKDNTEALNKGIGSGPFKLKENNEGESIVYERYDDYYRGKADLDQVIIKMMHDKRMNDFPFLICFQYLF